MPEHKMVKLGKTEAEMYPSMTPDKNKKQIIYPSAQLPLSLLSKNAELGDVVKITIKAKITGMQNNKYNKSFDYDAIEAGIY